MKVILLTDVKSLGKAGQLVNVNDGYARNYILPKKLGVEATNKNLNDLKMKKANEEKIAQQQLEEAELFKAQIEKAEIALSIKAGENGKLFGSISSMEIAEAARKQFGLVVDKKKLQLPKPIKTLGVHEVPIKLHPKVTATLKVVVKEQ